MKFIVITSPDFLSDEAELITELFDCGLDVLHLRKPGAPIEACMRLLDAVPAEWHGRIVTHDHFALCRDYGLQGIHLNRRNPEKPDFIMAERARYTVSASCHSVAEVSRCKPDMDYVFMSPIFNSISKQGYSAAYSCGELEQAASCGILDDRVMALGGISIDCIPMLKRWHFGGAAFLGDVWNRAGLPSFAAYVASLAALLHA